MVITPMKVVDLFSGAGGTGLGFRQAGFQILGAVEINKYAAKTYEKNLGVKVNMINIRDLEAQAFREELNLQQSQLDVLVGCPPCQGFSRMQNNKGANHKDNDLVLKYLEFVEEFMPRFAVLENVPGLITKPHGRIFYEKLCLGLKELGYKSNEKLVDVADYGVPQHRQRVIVIAGRNGEEPPFPQPTHREPRKIENSQMPLLPWFTVWDAIGNNKYPKLKPGENGEHNGKYPNHIAPKTTQRIVEFIRLVPKNGGSRTDIPKEFWLKCHLSHKGHSDVYGRAAWNRPSNTITAGCLNPSKGRFIHPEQDRAFTPREVAALQGFPDDFVFYGKCLQVQIGNAVPPPLAKAIAQELKHRLLQS